MEIGIVGVVGAGSMGSGIAQVAAQAGYSVVLHDVEKAFTARAMKNIAGNLDRAVAKGKMSKADCQRVLARIKATESLDDLAGAGVVIEAIVEKVGDKLSLFRQLDNICRQGAIIASNTSSISITRLAAGTLRADRVAGMHFFNPAPVMKLVEIIRGYYTSDDTVATLREVALKMGKVSIEVKKDTPGFVVNRLLLPFLREAFILCEEGVASPQDIDTAVRYGLNHPMGPFELSDLTGLDVVHDVLCYYREEFGQPHYSSPISLKRMVNAARLGRKAGKGWFTYTD